MLHVSVEGREAFSQFSVRIKYKYNSNNVKIDYLEKYYNCKKNCFALYRPSFILYHNFIVILIHIHKMMSQNVKSHKKSITIYKLQIFTEKLLN